MPGDRWADIRKSMTESSGKIEPTSVQGLSESEHAILAATLKRIPGEVVCCNDPRLVVRGEEEVLPVARALNEAGIVHIDEVARELEWVGVVSSDTAGGERRQRNARGEK